MKKKKKVWPVILILVLVLGIAAAIYFLVIRKGDKSSESGEKVYVESVADIVGAGYIGMDKFMGVVESQEVKYVDKAEDKKVSEIFVEEGDVVSEGDKLFSYDTDDMTLKLRQLELELTSINNSISTANQQIKTLATERDAAPAEEKIDYTTQIQSLQAQINQYNYDASNKQLEIDRQKSAIENSVVFSPMDGTIKTINNSTDNGENNGDYNNYYGDYQNQDANHFISIMAAGDYRVKCTANEMNARMLMVGEPMIVKSRVDESRMWRGTISLVDLEHPVQNNDYYDGGGETVTKYPFYIELESIEGLMLGEHLYAEYDYGQGEVKEGLWLYEYYIVMDGDLSYVWAEDKNGKIEKRVLTLGEYDENNMSYQILDGLSTSDFIAFPEDRIKDGMIATHDIMEVLPDMDMEDGMMEDGMMEDGMMEDGMYDDGMYDDGMYDDGMYDDGMYEDGMYDDGEVSVEGEVIDDGDATFDDEIVDEMIKEDSSEGSEDDSADDGQDISDDASLDGPKG